MGLFDIFRGGNDPKGEADLEAARQATKQTEAERKEAKMQALKENSGEHGVVTAGPKEISDRVDEITQQNPVVQPESTAPANESIQPTQQAPQEPNETPESTPQSPNPTDSTPPPAA